MFCWQARRYLSDVLEGDRPAAPGPRLGRHLESCDRCRSELDALGRLASLVKAIGKDPLDGVPVREAAAGFEDRVVRALRARSLEAHRAQAATRFTMAPVSLGIAIVSLAVVILLGLYFGGRVATIGFEPQLVADRQETGAAQTGASDPSGGLEPNDIPFQVRQDLVGTRRGSIPTVTYVLEPAPEERDEEAVLRASY